MVNKVVYILLKVMICELLERERESIKTSRCVSDSKLCVLGSEHTVHGVQTSTADAE